MEIFALALRVDSRVSTSDTSERVVDYRIPLSINTWVFGQKSTEIMRSVYESVYGRRLGRDGQVVLTGEAVYRPHKSFLPFGFTPLEEIAHRQALGILTTHMGSTSDFDNANALVLTLQLAKANGESQPPISVKFTLVRNCGVPELFEAMSVGERIGELVLEIGYVGYDTVAAAILAATLTNCTSLCRLQIVSRIPFPSRHLDILENLVDMVSHGRHHQAKLLTQIGR